MNLSKYGSMKDRIDGLNLLTGDEQKYYAELMQVIGRTGQLSVDQNKQLDELARRSEARAKEAYPPHRYGRLLK